jgi:hypothetical protein
LAINSAVIVKKGMASNVKPPKELNITSGTIIIGIGDAKASVIIVVNPMAMNIGSPENRRIKNTGTRMVIIAKSPWTCF